MATRSELARHFRSRVSGPGAMTGKRRGAPGQAAVSGVEPKRAYVLALSTQSDGG